MTASGYSRELDGLGRQFGEQHKCLWNKSRAVMFRPFVLILRALPWIVAVDLSGFDGAARSANGIAVPSVAARCRQSRPKT